MILKHKEGGNMMLPESTIQWKAAIGCLSNVFASLITQKIGHKITYEGGLTARDGITSHPASTNMSSP